MNKTKINLLMDFQCVKELRKLEYTTPVIALSANSMMEAKEEALNFGMNDFLLKPVQIEDLRGVLGKWI